jgi:hypothetical protein
LIFAPVEAFQTEPEPVSPSARTVPNSRPQPQRWVFLVLGLVALGVVYSFFSARNRQAPPEPVKFVLAPGADVHDLAVSPDGQSVAFVTREGGAHFGFVIFPNSQERRRSADSGSPGRLSDDKMDSMAEQIEAIEYTFSDYRLFSPENRAPRKIRRLWLAETE